jgi:hypothetical protein
MDTNNHAKGPFDPPFLCPICRVTCIKSHRGFVPHWKSWHMKTRLSTSNEDFLEITFCKDCQRYFYNSAGDRRCPCKKY